MPRIFLTCILSAVLFSSLPAAAQDKSKYQPHIIGAVDQLKPEVLLVISKDHKMFQQAYSTLVDVDGDGRIDTGFNPRAVYYGYFDSYSCYEQVPGDSNDPAGYFQRVKATEPDDDDEVLEAARLKAKVLDRTGKGAAQSRTGICQKASKKEGGERIGSKKKGGDYYYSGNWLNYITATRMDVIRKALYGGFRNVDDLDKTILTSSFVPNDAHVWGSDVMSDDRWDYDSPLVPYYDISKYTPFNKPAKGQAHFFARGRSTDDNNYPALFVLLDVEHQVGWGNDHNAEPRLTLQSRRLSTGASETKPGRIIAPTGNHPLYKGRWFNWVMGDAPNPSSKTRLTKNAEETRVKTLPVRVEVCKQDNYGPTEGCQKYPNGNLKPVGLLQRYGAVCNMNFGLMTGFYGSSMSYSGTAKAGTWNYLNYRNQGGVLRHHIAPIEDYDVFDKNGNTIGRKYQSVNSKTGQIRTHGKTQGLKHPKGTLDTLDTLDNPVLPDSPNNSPDSLIWTLDTLRITGLTDAHMTGSEANKYQNSNSWGNPLGEMLYEAVRYFARRAQADAATKIQPTKGTATSSTHQFLPYIASSATLIANPTSNDGERSNTSGATSSSGTMRYNDQATKYFPSGSAAYYSDWTTLPPLPLNNLAKPIILVIGDADTEFDGDHGVNSPTNLNQAPLNGLTSTAFPSFNMDTYLKNITDNEFSLGGLNAGTNYIYVKGRTDYCKPQKLTNLKDVKGMCPNSPAFEGTYSAAAVAYYAHTHDFSSAELDAERRNVPLDIFAVNMAGAYPELSFPLYSGQDENKTLVKKITIQPAALSHRHDSSTNDRIISFINYYIMDWKTDKNGTPYYVKIRVNFEDAVMGRDGRTSGSNTSDWDLDVMVDYTIQLLYKEDSDNNPDPVAKGNQYSTLCTTTNSGNYAACGCDPNPNPEIRKTISTKCATAPGDYKNIKGYHDGKIQQTESKENCFDFNNANIFGWNFGRDNGDKYNSYNDAPLDEGSPLPPGSDYHPGFRAPAPIANNPNQHYSASRANNQTDATAIATAETLWKNKFYRGRSSGELKVKGGIYCPYKDPRQDGDGMISTEDKGHLDDYYINPEKVAGLMVTTKKVAAGASIPMAMGYSIRGSARDGIYMDRVHTRNDELFKNITTPLCEWPKSYGGATKAQCNWSNVAGTGSATKSCENYDCPDPSATTNQGRFWRQFMYRFSYSSSYPGESATEDDNHWMNQTERYSHTRTFLFNELNGVRNDLDVDDDPNEAQAGKLLPNPLYLAAKYGGFTDLDRDGKGVNGVPDEGEWENIPGKPESGPHNYFEVTNLSDLPALLDKTFMSISLDMTKNVYMSDSAQTGTSASISTIIDGGLAIRNLFYPKYPDSQVNWLGSVYGLFVDKWGNLREDTDGDGQLTTRNDQPTMNGQSNPRFPSGDLVVKFETGADNKLVVRRYYDISGNGQWQGNFYDENKGQLAPLKLKALWDTSRSLADPNYRSLADPNYSRYQSQSSRNIYYGEQLKKFSLANADDLASKMITADTKTRLRVANDETLAQKLINYIRGETEPETLWRPREVKNPWSGSGNLTWLLGDLLNSKPVIVGQPAFNYDTIYNDDSANSYQEYKAEKAKRRQVAYFGANDGMLHAINLGFFDVREGKAGFCEDSEDCAKLGQELWAYVPTSVLPHLQWLADRDYKHAYFVDMKPLIADIEDDEGNWRSILIGGLRLGGREIELKPNDMSYSEFFALDITDTGTDPDEPPPPPRFLWRFSAEELGLSVGLPTVVKAEDKNWYVVLASGPKVDLCLEEELTGEPCTPSLDSPYEGYSDQLARLFVLDALTGKPVGNLNLTVKEDDKNSFFNDSFLMMADPKKEPDNAWHHQLVYYGLTTSPTTTGPEGCMGAGAVYRLHLKGAPESWELKRLINVERPVTGAVNATLKDGRYWVIFGTGRLWAATGGAGGGGDLRPCAINDPACELKHTQYIYGVKEPVGSDGLTLTYGELTETADQLAAGGKIIDVTGALVKDNGEVDLSGMAGGEALGEALGLASNETITTYKALSAHIKEAEVGYRRQLSEKYEMILTQPKLGISPTDGNPSFMSFTSFSPYRYRCYGSWGNLYLLDTFTGLTAPYMHEAINEAKARHQRNWNPEDDWNQPLDTGQGKPTEASVMVTENGVKITATGGQNGEDYEIFLYGPGSSSGTTGLRAWREALDIGFKLSKDAMIKGME